jgi:hypothetical protein
MSTIGRVKKINLLSILKKKNLKHEAVTEE